MNKRKVRPYRHYKNKLQKILKFTDEDLEANRHGYITDAQADELKIQAFRDSALYFLPFLFIFGEGIWGFFISPDVHARLLACLVPIYLTTLAFGIFGAIRVWQDYANDISSEVATASGLISFQIGYRGSVLMRIGDEGFESTPEIHQLLGNDSLPANASIVYYTAKTKKLLSIFA